MLHPFQALGTYGRSLHMERGKWDGYEIVEKILDVYRDWGPELTGIEASHIQAAIGPFLEKRITERRLGGFAYEPLPPKNRDISLLLFCS